jgi:hypothetical protein
MEIRLILPRRFIEVNSKKIYVGAINVGTINVGAIFVGAISVGAIHESPQLRIPNRPNEEYRIAPTKNSESP